MCAPVVSHHCLSCVNVACSVGGRSLAAAVFSSQNSSMLNEIGPSHARTEGQTAAPALHPSRKIFPPRGLQVGRLVHSVHRRRQDDARTAVILRSSAAVRPSMVDADEDDAADFAYKVVNARPLPSPPPLSPASSFPPPSSRPTGNACNAINTKAIAAVPRPRSTSSAAQDEDRDRPLHG